jgi:hypothetical protein
MNMEQDMEQVIIQWNTINIIGKVEKKMLRRTYKNMLYSQSYYNYFFNQDINKFIKIHMPLKNIDNLNLFDCYQLLKIIDKHTKLTREQKHSVKMISDTLIIDNIDDYKKKIFYNPKLFFTGLIERKIHNNKFKVLEYSDTYEYGIQKATCNKKMYYIKFYDMLVLDIDTDTDTDYNELKDYLLQYKRFKFRVYKTFKGYHVFITNMLFNYSREVSVEVAKALGSDLYYLLYTKYNGYTVRLSPKIGRKETITHAFV